MTFDGTFAHILGIGPRTVADLEAKGYLIASECDNEVIVNLWPPSLKQPKDPNELRRILGLPCLVLGKSEPRPESKKLTLPREPTYQEQVAGVNDYFASADREHADRLTLAGDLIIVGAHDDRQRWGNQRGRYHYGLEKVYRGAQWNNPVRAGATRVCRALKAPGNQSQRTNIPHRPGPH